MGGSLAPHDVRRTFAKLAHKVRVPLEQIQITLGHASIQTNMTPVTSRGGAGVDVASDYRKLAEADLRAARNGFRTAEISTKLPGASLKG